ncbi:MAG: hypothetical protein WKF50_08350 [Nocardioides sp.]
MRTTLLLCLAALATVGALLRGSWHRAQADFWRTTARMRCDAEQAAAAPPPAGDPTRTTAAAIAYILDANREALPSWLTP